MTQYYIDYASILKTHFLLQNSIELQLEFCGPHWKTRANRRAAGAKLSEYCDSPMDIAFELSHAASRLLSARTLIARRRGTTSTRVYRWIAKERFFAVNLLDMRTDV
jgi:hypothetical protein